MNEDEQQPGSSVEIRSVRVRRCFRLHSRNGEYFVAAIEGDGLSGSCGIYAYTDGNVLSDLFQSIAADWRGWDGERCWESIEGDLRLAVTSTRTGQITIRVTLRNYYGDDEWQLVAPIFTEAGQLDTIARQVKSFFR